MQLRNKITPYIPAENIYKFLPVDLDQPCDSLTIILSSIKGKFLLKGYSINSDRLFIAESKMTSYTYGFEGLKDYLVKWISTKNYKNVNLVGSSKGGFGAINIGVALAKELKNVDFKVASFSPQTQLFPFNTNIDHLPSYIVLNRLAKTHISVQHDLKKYGNLEKIQHDTDDNIKISVIYGDSHERDTIECQRINACSAISYVPVPNYSLHSTLLIFTKKNEELVKAMTSRFTSTTKTDDDFFTPQNVDEITQDFLKSIDKYQYDLKDYLI